MQPIRRDDQINDITNDSFIKNATWATRYFSLREIKPTRKIASRRFFETVIFWRWRCHQITEYVIIILKLNALCNLVRFTYVGYTSPIISLAGDSALKIGVRWQRGKSPGFHCDAVLFAANNHTHIHCIGTLQVNAFTDRHFLFQAIK